VFHALQWKMWQLMTVLPVQAEWSKFILQVSVPNSAESWAQASSLWQNWGGCQRDRNLEIRYKKKWKIQLKLRWKQGCNNTYITAENIHFTPPGSDPICSQISFWFGVGFPNAIHNHIITSGRKELDPWRWNLDTKNKYS